MQDGTSATTFRLISGLSCYQPGVIACTFRYPNTGAVNEADQVYSQTQPWWAGTGDPTASYYDLLSMATHESGHELGLGHVSSDWLTMGTTLCPGCVRWRDLGRGDVLGMRARYP